MKTKIVYIDTETEAAIKLLQSQRPLPNLSALLKQLVKDAVKPETGAAVARRLWLESEHCYPAALELLQEYMHRQYKDWVSTPEHPAFKRWDSIRHELWELSKQQ